MIMKKSRWTSDSPPLRGRSRNADKYSTVLYFVWLHTLKSCTSSMLVEILCLLRAHPWPNRASVVRSVHYAAATPPWHNASRLSLQNKDQHRECDNSKDECLAARVNMWLWSGVTSTRRFTGKNKSTGAAERVLNLALVG